MKSMNWKPKRGEVTIPQVGAMPEIGHRHSRSAPIIELVGNEETSMSISPSGPLNRCEKSHRLVEEDQEKPTSEINRPGELPRYSTEDEMSLAATIGAELADNFGVFSIELDRQPAGEERCEERCEAGNAASKPDADYDTISMEVPIQLAAKDRRPKIQVTIPQLRPLSAVGAHRRGKKLGQQIHQTTNKSESSSSMVSPASSITQQTIECGNSTAQLSVISPISVVEMPRPRRPFSSGFSLQGAEVELTTPHTAPLPTVSQSAISDSSDDTGEQDDRSSIYSLRSSMSSLASENALRKVSEARRPSLAFSVLSPADAGVFDTMPSTPKYPKTAKSTNTLASLVNRNKPLPPEPTTSTSEVAPLNLTGQSLSRTGSMKARRRIPAPLNVTKETTDKFSRRFSRAFSLRSKYTPADLDALDEAFRKTSPLKTAPSFYSAHTTQTLSQAELALEAQLLTINEDAAFIDWDVVPLVHDPLQIRRGPMHMEPSRPVPSPPSRNAPSERAASPRKKLQKRSPSHVAMQLRAAECAMKRVSMPVVGSSLKAHRVLGTLDDMSGSPTSTMMGREASAESNWSSGESPRLYALSTGSDSALSLGGPSTPESIASSVDDAAFEEVRKRMQLLGPKHDQAETFSVYCNSDVSVSPDQLPIQQQSTDRTSLDSSRSASSTKSQTDADKQSIADRKNSGISVSVRCAPFGESHIHPLERRGRKDEKPVRSLASITMSEIPEIYASLPSPRSTIRPSMTAEEMEHAISAEAAEKVLLRILQNLDNLEDLFATATVSRGFYRTFKRHELALTKGALFAMSAAAWELREMSPAYPHSNEPDSASPQSEYTPSLYLRHYMNDMYIMIHLKSMILVHCESFLRADTIAALAGAESERSSQIDNAFWRVWTFCRIFGCGKNREDDIDGQIDWLKGGKLARQQSDNAKDTNSVLPAAFGRGNGNGLTAEELYDMNEIWICLGVLVRGFHGKREEAREHGIFNGTDIAPGNVEKEDAMLGKLISNTNTTFTLANNPPEEWTHHLLTLAPSTVLDVSSPAPTSSAAFAHARSRGYTIWTPPTTSSSRSTFLKEAVSRVYEEKMNQRHHSPTSASPQSQSPTLLDPILASRQRCAQHAVEIRARREDPAYQGLFPTEERPMSNYPSVLHKLETAPAANNCTPLVFSQRPALTLKVPTTIIPLPTPPHSRNSSAADKVSLPLLLPTPSSTSSSSSSSAFVPVGPQVRDPVDVAMERLVGMGFEEGRVKKALAETDSGNSVSFEKALERLVREQKRCVTSIGGSWIL